MTYSNNSNVYDQVHQYVSSMPNKQVCYNWIWDRFPNEQVGTIVNTLVEQGKLRFSSRHQMVYAN
jgi:hypothetical protein